MHGMTYLGPFLHGIHDGWLGQFARSSRYVFTTGLVLHFFGLTLLMGSMLIVDLRLLGFPRQLPIAAAMKFLPLAIGGFVLNLLTGIVMFAFDPVDYWLNPSFRIKMVFVLLAGLNALWFTIAEHRQVLSQPADQRTTTMVRVSATLSLVLWFAIIFWGRMIVAFLGSADFSTG